MEPIQITINLNIIVGDINGSAVIQGSDGNTVEVLPPNFFEEVLEMIRRLAL